MVDKDEPLKHNIEQQLKDYGSSDDNVHYLARDNLIGIGERNWEALAQFANNPSPIVRGSIVELVSSIKQEQSYLLLLNAMSDPSAYVRSKAACALNQWRDKRSVEPMKNALSDSDDITRRWAATNLGHLGDASVADLLFQTAIEDKDEWVRLHAAESLSKLGDERGVPILEILKDRTVESGVRGCASGALHRWYKLHSDEEGIK